MISFSELLLRLALGALFGGIIGYERQAHGRPAGFRTQMLVCVASVLIMEVSVYFHYLSAVDPRFVRIDPGRIAAGAITGVGFLGAGVIVKTGATVQGLTTAACLWMVSAIGLAVGSGLYISSTAAFLLTLFSLTVLRTVETKTSRLIFKNLTVTAGEDFMEKEIDAVLKKHRADIHNIDFEVDAEQKETVCRYTIAFQDTEPLKEMVDELSSIGTVKRVALRG
jgi:putative Mg2+ transporter-C (MgtC) family protein